MNISGTMKEIIWYFRKEGINMNIHRAIAKGYNTIKALRFSESLKACLKDMGMWEEVTTTPVKITSVGDARGLCYYDAELCHYCRETESLYGKCHILRVNNGIDKTLVALVSYESVVAIIYDGMLIEFDYHMHSATTDRHLREFAKWFNLDMEEAMNLGLKKTEYIYNGMDILR